MRGPQIFAVEKLWLDLCDNSSVVFFGPSHFCEGQGQLFALEERFLLCRSETKQETGTTLAADIWRRQQKASSDRFGDQPCSGCSAPCLPPMLFIRIACSSTRG